jgi:hypothetical protein
MKVGSDIPDGKLLDPLDEVSEALSDVPHKHIHIIVQHPHGACGFLFQVIATLNDIQLPLRASNT